jgi:hypothetical protein
VENPGSAPAAHALAQLVENARAHLLRAEITGAAVHVLYNERVVDASSV